MTLKSKFWPLDYEPEDEIYENLSWDLPGLRRTRRSTSRNPHDATKSEAK
jgi:hypothetical protein